MEDDAPGIRRIETYEEARVLTLDAGLVIEPDDGLEFQIMVVRGW